MKSIEGLMDDLEYAVMARLGGYAYPERVKDCRTAIAELATAQAAPAVPAGRARTPQDYAIEHADYMATSAERLIAAANDLAKAEQEHDEGTANESDVDAARETLGEMQRSLENRIYEFRKRRDRASDAAAGAQKPKGPELDAAPLPDLLGLIEKYGMARFWAGASSDMGTKKGHDALAAEFLASLRERLSAPQGGQQCR